MNAILFLILFATHALSSVDIYLANKGYEVVGKSQPVIKGVDKIYTNYNLSSVIFESNQINVDIEEKSLLVKTGSNYIVHLKLEKGSRSYYLVNTPEKNVLNFYNFVKNKKLSFLNKLRTFMDSQAIAQEFQYNWSSHGTSNSKCLENGNYNVTTMEQTYGILQEHSFSEFLRSAMSCAGSALQSLNPIESLPSSVEVYNTGKKFFEYIVKPSKALNDLSKKWNSIEKSWKQLVSVARKFYDTFPGSLGASFQSASESWNELSPQDKSELLCPLIGDGLTAMAGMFVTAGVGTAVVIAKVLVKVRKIAKSSPKLQKFVEKLEKSLKKLDSPKKETFEYKDAKGNIKKFDRGGGNLIESRFKNVKIGYKNPESHYRKHVLGKKGKYYQDEDKNWILKSEKDFNGRQFSSLEIKNSQDLKDAAIKFLSKSGDEVMDYETNIGSIIRMDLKTGEFAAIRKNGSIDTYYLFGNKNEKYNKAKALEYFNSQMERFD